MSHVIIILDNKLDCIAANYPAAADSSELLKRSANSADDYYNQTLLNSNLPNGDEVHEKLEEVQLFATNVCDGGTDLTMPQLCSAMDGFRTDITNLLP